MTGLVVTFYSYKGGVGRSFALANIAVILSQWGAKVLVVDWDIEAPGLNHYFDSITSGSKKGVLDFLSDCQHDQVEAWRSYASPVSLPNAKGKLYLMPSVGSDITDYTNRVQNLNWDELYERHAFGERIEKLRDQWTEHFDFVLIDSRTGVTDFSGLTTAQLPDVLAFLFSASAQSLEGCIDIARRAMEARRSLPIDRPALLPLPIPARFEQREEYERAKEWRERFVKDTSVFLDNWTPQGTDQLKLIDLLTIPYVPRWTFGEDLAALEEATGSTGSRTASQAVSYTLETLAALLVLGFSQIDLLVSSRDEYVHAARTAANERRIHLRHAPKVFLSYSRENAKAARQIAHYLEKSGIELWYDLHDLQLGSHSFEQIQNAIEESDSYMLLIGNSQESRWINKETDTIRRHSLRSQFTKPIIPVVLPEGREAFYKSQLADYNAILIELSMHLLEKQLQPAIDRIFAAYRAREVARENRTGWVSGLSS